MRDFTLSERTKDRLLNIALVGSIMVLVGGFVHQAPVKKGVSPVSNHYKSQQVQPITINELPTYEPIVQVPSVSKNISNTAVQQVPVATVTQPAAEDSVPPTSKPSSSVSTRPKRTIPRVTNSLSNVLRNTKLNLL